MYDISARYMTLTHSMNTDWADSASDAPAHHGLTSFNHAFFFFNDTATTEIYTLSLHDALPISCPVSSPSLPTTKVGRRCSSSTEDRKSTRLNSSNATRSYAVFCLKKKNQK